MAGVSDRQKSYQECLQKFGKQKNRVTKGAKEAKWNYKYLKVIEMPVTQITNAKQLKELSLCLVPMMKSIKHIYENSNFYKEVRIVSLLDRLLENIIAKIKTHINISQALRQGRSGGFDKFADDSTQIALSLIKKYAEHFFISGIMHEGKESSVNNSNSSGSTNSTNETSSESSSSASKQN
jgi:hypothetical protein